MKDYEQNYVKVNLIKEIIGTNSFVINVFDPVFHYFKNY